MQYSRQGDMIARADVSGLKRPAPGCYRPCHVCNVTVENLVDSVCTGAVDPLRSVDTARDAKTLESYRTQSKRLYKSESKLQGIARCSGMAILLNSRNSRLAIHRFPGAQITQQLLNELLHNECEGVLIVHWENYSQLLEDAWRREGFSNFWSTLSHRSAKHFRSNHVDALPRFPSWNEWRYSLTGDDKLKFAKHSLGFLGSMLVSGEAAGEAIDEMVGTDEHTVDNAFKSKMSLAWRTWMAHVAWVNCMTQHAILPDELAAAAENLRALHVGLVELYGPDIVTINTHNQTHTIQFTHW
jgi:hypothetical protein